MFIVYVMKNKEGRVYIGQTEDLTRRLSQHNKKPKRGYRWDKKQFQVVYQETFPTRAEAMHRERMLKSGQGRKWLKNFLKE